MTGSTKRKLQVLIVDDSATFRNLISEVLKGEDDLQVAGSLPSGNEAVEFIKKRRPDVVTLDVEMPGMDGLQTLQAIQRHNEKDPGQPEIGVIMVSAYTRKGAEITINCLEAGAFDFIAKPSTPDLTESMNILRRQLLVKLRHFSVISKRGRSPREAPAPKPAPRPGAAPAPAPPPRGARAILIGVSTGGPKALSKIIPELSNLVQLPVLIVQHMPPTFTASFAETLDRKCRHRVKEAEDGEALDNATIYIAPGGKHMLLRKGHGNSLKVAVNEAPPENGFRPSVDVLFRAAAQALDGRALAIILTGMGSDGTRGLATLKRAGAYTMVQDEATSVVWGMPGNAVESGNVDEVLPLTDIPAAAAKLTKGE